MVCTTVPVQGLLTLDRPSSVRPVVLLEEVINNSHNKCRRKYASIAQCVYEYSLSIIYSLRCGWVGALA